MVNILHGRTRRWTAGLAGVVLAASTVVAGAAPAQAATQRVFFENAKIRKMCLDDSRSHHLRVTHCYWNAYQTWYEIPKASGAYFTLKNYKTGHCLDHSNRYHIRAIKCNGGRYQQWWGDREEPDFLKNRKTGKCLDYSRSHGLRATRCPQYHTGNDYQLWWSYVPN